MGKINLLISSSKEGKGGIATVVNVYEQQGFFRKWNINYLATGGATSKLFNFTLFLITVLKLVILLGTKDVGVVHIHMASRGSYFRKSLLVRLVKLFNRKVILHLHGAEFQSFYTGECSSKKQQHIRDTFNMADKVIVLSSQWLRWVRTIVENTNKVCVVYNAVPELELPVKKVEDQVILFLGRLGQRKGVGDLISAFSKLASQFPNCQLHLGGDGDLLTYQMQIDNLGLQEQIKLLGWVSGERKNQCLADATIYCLPSYNEGFPMGVLEAMSAGIPVVASKAGGIPDAIEHKKEGLLIEAGDVEALAKSLTALLKSSDSRVMYSTAAKIKYRENFSPQVIMPQLERIYNELLGNT
ncbi:MAG: glycosyltransferase family 4 protein [Colwellia sp.]|jgi:Glycosyltransferase